MKVLYWIFLIIVLLAAIDTLLYGIWEIDVILAVFPDVVTTAADGTTATAMSIGTQITYIVFGIAGVWVVAANLFGSKKSGEHIQA